MASTSAAPPKKSALKNKFFTAKSEGVKYLLDQFRKFSEDPDTGINFQTRQNTEIKNFFSQHPIFADFSERAFVEQFKKYANNYQLEQTRHRAAAIPQAAATTAASRPAKQLAGKF